MSGSIPSLHSVRDSRPNDVFEIPGFYYDRQKKRYFRVLRDADATVSGAVSRETVSTKKAEERFKTRVKLLAKHLHSDSAETSVNENCPSKRRKKDQSETFWAEFGTKSACSSSLPQLRSKRSNLTRTFTRFAAVNDSEYNRNSIPYELCRQSLGVSRNGGKVMPGLVKCISSLPAEMLQLSGRVGKCGNRVVKLHTDENGSDAEQSFVSCSRKHLQSKKNLFKPINANILPLSHRDAQLIGYKSSHVIACYTKVPSLQDEGAVTHFESLSCTLTAKCSLKNTSRHADPMFLKRHVHATTDFELFKTRKEAHIKSCLGRCGSYDMLLSAYTKQSYDASGVWGDSYYIRIIKALSLDDSSLFTSNSLVDLSRLDVSVGYGQPVCISCSVDGSEFAVGTKHGLCVKSLMRPGLPSQKFRGKGTAEVTALAYSNQNKNELVAGEMRPRIVWYDQRESGGVAHVLHTRAGVSNIHLTRDDTYLIVAEFDGNLSMYDMRSRSVVMSYAGHTSDYAPRSMVVDEDEHFLCAAGKDGQVRLWDVRSGALLKTLMPPWAVTSRDCIPSVLFSTDLGQAGPGIILHADLNTLFYYTF